MLQILEPANVGCYGELKTRQIKNRLFLPTPADSSRLVHSPADSFLCADNMRKIPVLESPRAGEFHTS